MDKKWCYFKEVPVLSRKEGINGLSSCSSNGYFLVDMLKDEVHSMIKKSVKDLDYFSIVVRLKDNNCFEYSDLSDFLVYFDNSKEEDVGDMVIDVRSKLDKGDVNEDYLTLFKVRLFYR